MDLAAIRAIRPVRHHRPVLDPVLTVVAAAVTSVTDGSAPTAENCVHT